MKPLEKVEYLIIHHTGRNFDFPFFVKTRHKYLRGWEDIGYYYLIGNGLLFTKDGQLYRGRPEELQGAHTLSHNQNSLGICLIGNLDKNQPTKKQLSTLLSLLEEKIRESKISSQNVLGHNEIQGVKKSCPGRFVNMNLIRTLLYIEPMLLEESNGQFHSANLIYSPNFNYMR